jgi:hypothetical protein
MPLRHHPSQNESWASDATDQSSSPKKKSPFSNTVPEQNKFPKDIALEDAAGHDEEKKFTSAAPIPSQKAVKPASYWRTSLKLGLR